MSFPTQFDQATYVAWHHSTIASDVDLAAKLVAFRDGLKTSTRPQLDALVEMLGQVAKHTTRDVKRESKKILLQDFKLPREEIVGTGGVPSDKLFKPVKSIIEKMWRKNAARTRDYVCLSNLQAEIGDLIRTSVVAPTLWHASEFAERLEDWKDYVDVAAPAAPGGPDLSLIEKVEVDPEAKLESGYFAHHAMVTFNNALRVEVQVFSELTSAWRAVSHSLYERTRVGGTTTLAPGAPDARLVSLGHLLHLADLELHRLVKEYSGKS